MDADRSEGTFAGYDLSRDFVEKIIVWSLILSKLNSLTMK